MLVKDAGTIDRWAAKSAITERRSFTLEKNIFLAAYAMRKLFDAGKLTSATDNKELRCKTFPAFDKKTITRWSAYKIEELYDLSNPDRQTIKIRTLLNVIIHSLVFCEHLRRNNTVQGFLVTSDLRRSNLWQINLRQFTSMMRYIADDRPTVIHRSRDGETENWIEWRGKRK